MKLRRIAALFVVCLMTAWFAATGLADERTGINAFYGKFRAELNKPDSSARRLALLVKENPALAEKCLSVIKAKVPSAGTNRESFEFFRDALEAVLLASKQGHDCSEQVVGKLVRLGKDETRTADNRIFFLEGAVRLCPDAGKSSYAMLGDLYMHDRQFEMAVGAYERALKYGPDPDTEKFLEEARKRQKSYDKAKSVEDKDAYAMLLMAPVKASLGGIRRKVSITSAIQTNKILFDEWSAEIKEQSIPQLTAVGDSLKTAFHGSPDLQIVIEGHTDERGPEARNLQLSQQRAEAVKNYLVEKYGVDPSRISTKGYGPWKPFSPRKDEEGWKLNRRVEFKKVNGPQAR